MLITDPAATPMTRTTYIECDRLRLETPTEEDVSFLQSGVNHPAIREYIGAFRTPYTEQRYEEELWSAETGEDAVSLLVVPDEDEFADEPVGSVQLYPIRDAEGYANFGVWLLPEAWGNGYALEAGAHLIEFGFQELGLHRVSATVTAPNDDSRALCERLGFTHEGAAREAAIVHGEYVDVARYGLLVDEWDGPAAVLDQS